MISFCLKQEGGLLSLCSCIRHRRSHHGSGPRFVLLFGRPCLRALVVVRSSQFLTVHFAF
jgi:hypothetical protein